MGSGMALANSEEMRQADENATNSGENNIRAGKHLGRTSSHA
jgi:hypothetical protein